MKRNFPSAFPQRSPAAFKMHVGAENAPACSRRSLLVAAGLLSLVPRFALGAVFECGPGFRISVLAALTGPYAGVQSKYYQGVVEAANAANARGCRVEVVARDAAPSPQSLISAALASERVDHASVIIAPFGPAVARQVAEKASSAVIFDIAQPGLVASRPANWVTLPYALFFTANPDRRDESLRTVGRVAAGIVLETIQLAPPGSITSPSGLVDAMARRKFDSPKGTLALNRTSGAFDLI